MKRRVIIVAGLVLFAAGCSSPGPAGPQNGPASAADAGKGTVARPASREPATDVPPQVQEERARQRRDPWGATKEDSRAKKEEFLKGLIDPNKLGASGVKYFSEREETLTLKWDERSWDDLAFSQKEAVVAGLGKQWVDLRGGSGDGADTSSLVIEGFKKGKRLGSYSASGGAEVTAAK